MNINKNNGVLWYVLSLGMSMSYLPIKGIVLMIGSASLQGGYSGDYMAGCGCWF